jgi:hypothetical protein
MTEIHGSSILGIDGKPYRNNTIRNGVLDFDGQGLAETPRKFDLTLGAYAKLAAVVLFALGAVFFLVNRNDDRINRLEAKVDQGFERTRGDLETLKVGFAEVRATIKADGPADQKQRAMDPSEPEGRSS